MQPPTAHRTGAAAIVFFVLAVVLGLTHPAALAAPQTAPRPAAVYDVRDYGAKGDGSSNDTPAVNKAITAANSAGGGTVRFPAGSYKSKNTIHMKSNVTLQVDKGATIQGSSADTYDAPESNPYDRYQDYGHSHFHNAMIYGDRLTNIGFVGAGVIDGLGNLITGNPEPGEADKIISLTRCDGLRLGDGLTLRRGGHFAALINGCKNVTSDHLNIDTASDRDGWNIISSTDVAVTNAAIKANDDALVFKSDYALGAKLPNGHVRVSDSYLSARCCNALMFGSETCGDFSDYRFEHIRIEGADKSGLGMVSMDGAKISDVHYRDITMTNVHSPIMEKIGTRKRCGNSPGVGSIDNVTYDDITATGNSPSFSPTLWGENGHRISGITFTNVNITVPGGNETMSTAVPGNAPNDYNPKSIGTRPAYGWYLHNADNIQFTDSSVKFAANDGRPAVLANAASGIRFTRFTAQKGGDSPFDTGFQNVTGYCLTGSHNTTGGALRISASGSSENCGPPTKLLDLQNQTDTQAPTRPGQPSCSGIGEDRLTLAWGASTDNVGVTAYDLYEHGNKIGEAAGSSTSKALTGLAPNTTYNLTVIARDAAGNTSSASPVVDCTTKPSSDTTPPTKPGTLTVSGVTANSADLSWGASTDDRAVTAYDVRSGTTVYKTVTGGTSTTLTGLACNSPYALNVVARDAAGNVSEAGNTVDFTTKACATDGGVPSSIATLSTGWTIPWGTYWMPDGKTALVTERDDFRVWKVAKDGSRTQVGKVPGAVTTNGEGGLMGVAVDPRWDTNHHVYFMHTASEGNRVVRMTYDGTSLSNYTVLLRGIKKNRYHNGGRLAFGPDGYLYVSTGEAQTPDLAQDKNSLNGKILRMTTDGKPAPGNPFGNYVYSLGHRNPQGLAFDRSGRLWEAEFGNSSKDELNLIKPGANYGWPTCEGSCSVAGMTNPRATWNVSEASPSGIAIVRNVVYMASLRGERLWRIPINGDTERVGTPTAYYVGTYGRLRTVTKVPGADQLWLSTTNCDNNGGADDGSDKIFRVSIS